MSSTSSSSLQFFLSTILPLVNSSLSFNSSNKFIFFIPASSHKNNINNSSLTPLQLPEKPLRKGKNRV